MANSSKTLSKMFPVVSVGPLNTSDRMEKKDVKIINQGLEDEMVSD